MAQGPAKNPTCEIITIGSELLLGQIQDTNSTYLALELAKIGIDVRFRTSVGDDMEAMAMALRLALSRVDLVVQTGGLGPTEDDLTREVVSRVAGVSLEFRQELMDQIEGVFKRYSYRMPDSNRKQAYVPKGAISIENPVGTAPAFIVEVENRPVISLPGVPRELRYLWERKVAAWIRERFDLRRGRVLTRVLKVAGIGESKVDSIIGDLMRSRSNPKIGLLASPGEIRIQITASAKDEEEAASMIGPVEALIRARLGEKIFGTDEDTLEGVINRLLRDKGLSLYILETFTGGRVTQRLTSVPDSTVKGASFFRDPEEFWARYHLPSKERGESLVGPLKEILSPSPDSVLLLVTGLVIEKDGYPFVDAYSIAAGKGIFHEYPWQMGGEMSLLKERGAVIALNTLRLALLRVG